jgi:hypothetical protein
MPEGKKPLWRPRCWLLDSIKVCLIEMGGGYTELIWLKDLLNKIINLHVP